MQQATEIGEVGKTDCEAYEETDRTQGYDVNSVYIHVQVNLWHNYGAGNVVAFVALAQPA